MMNIGFALAGEYNAVRQPPAAEGERNTFVVQKSTREHVIATREEKSIPKRSELLQLRLTAAEKGEMERAAAEEGMSTSSWARAALMSTALAGNELQELSDRTRKIEESLGVITARAEMLNRLTDALREAGPGAAGQFNSLVADVAEIILRDIYAAAAMVKKTD